MKKIIDNVQLYCRKYLSREYIWNFTMHAIGFAAIIYVMWYTGYFIAIGQSLENGK